MRCQTCAPTDECRRHRRFRRSTGRAIQTAFSVPHLAERVGRRHATVRLEADRSNAFSVDTLAQAATTPGIVLHNDDTVRANARVADLAWT